jgi:hypothetical protein
MKNWYDHSVLRHGIQVGGRIDSGFRRSGVFGLINDQNIKRDTGAGKRPRPYNTPLLFRFLFIFSGGQG